MPSRPAPRPDRQPVSSFRAGAPNLRVDIDRSKAETLKVAVGDVFSTLSAYLGSTFVNRFNKFGLSLQVYVQADSHYRAHPEDVRSSTCAAWRTRWCRSARWPRCTRPGAPIITLYNLYPSSASSARRRPASHRARRWS